MYQLIDSVISWLNGPMYWDSASFLSSAAIKIAHSANLWSYLNSNMTDYPHTPLLIWTHALIYQIIGAEYWRLGVRLLSCCFAAALFIVGYGLIYTVTKNKTIATLTQLFILIDPVFWNQIYLSYFEIPALLFRTIALIYAIQGKWKQYLFWGIIAIGIRFDSVVYFAVFALLFIVTDYRYWKKTFPTSVLLVFIGLIWLTIHRFYSGWWLFGPFYGFDNSFQSTFYRAIKILASPSRRYLFIVLIIVISTAWVKKINIRETLFAAVFIVINIIISIVTYPLVRYFLPTFWITRIAIGALVPQLYSKKLSIVVIVLLIIWNAMSNNLLKKSGNGENMPGLEQELGAKISFYQQIYPIIQNRPILVDFPEDQEMVNPDYGFVDRATQFRPINIKNASIPTSTPTFCYILITPTSQRTREFSQIYAQELIKLKQMDSSLGNYQLYQNRLCQ